MTRTTLITHRVTVGLMGVVVLVATGDGFAQSYAGLLEWATEHGLKGWKANSFPLLVDLFIAVGELGLFALALEGHRLSKSGMAWADVALPFGIASAGWGVSLVFNVGAVRDDIADQATAAVPPVASMLGLLVLLRTVHRVITRGLVDQPLKGVANGYPLPAPTVTATALAVPDADDLQVRAARMFADDITAGRVPGIRAIKQQLKIGQDRAREVRTYLTALAHQ